MSPKVAFSNLKFGADQTGTCPHCGVAVKFITPSSAPYVTTLLSAIANEEVVGDITDTVAFKDTLYIDTSECPACHRLIALMRTRDPHTGKEVEMLAWPLGTRRPPVPPEVPRPIREDYEEAARVLPFSTKASGALSRRCLQHVLKDAGRTKSDWLAEQIKEVRQSLPTDIGENLDYVRTIGKFAAHPEKDKATGEIIDVEPGEAEWNLEVLDALFDHYYARPAREKKKREKFDGKLVSLGRKPIQDSRT
jgi:hypothetical protein